MTVAERKELRKTLEILSECTAVPITLFDENYEITEEFLTEKKFCRGFDFYYDRESSCRQLLRFSIDMAMNLAEPYFFFCSSGLVIIAMPVILHGVREGCVFAGPFSMGEIDSSIIENISEINHLTPKNIITISQNLNGIANFTAEHVQHFSNLMYLIIGGCFQNFEEYHILRKKYSEQIKSGNQVGKYRRFVNNSSMEIEYTELLGQMTKHILAKEKKKALHVLDDLLEKIFVYTSGNIDLIKLRVINVYAHMFDVAQKSGVVNQRLFTYKGTFLKRITEVHSLEEVTEVMVQEVKYYVDEVFIYVQKEHSPMMEDALAYIHENFMEKISLRDLAEHLHINESYLSKLFKKEFTKCFTDYVNEVRINHSIVLMRDQSKNLLDIANSVGFNNQSYYTKIFIKIKGVTPKHFRQEMFRSKKEKLEG